jgi:hypothetical protein
MLYPQEDFRKLNQGDVLKIAGLLNERPRKTLDFRTPYEVFSKLRQELPSAGGKKERFLIIIFDRKEEES